MTYGSKTFFKAAFEPIKHPPHHVPTAQVWPELQQMENDLLVIG